MKKIWKIVFGILIVLLILILSLILLRTPSGYQSGTTCPYYTKDCSCFGIKMSNPFDMSTGGKVLTYCYGIYLSNCKCYENGCPASTGYKKGIQCSE